MLKADNDRDHPLALQFADFIRDQGFPCVGAKAALQKRGMRFLVGRDLRSAWDDLRITPVLLQIAKDYAQDPRPFQSLVVLFEDGAPKDEASFERLLWERLQSLTDKDEWLGQPADPRVGHDPGDPHFAMSFGGQGFFVVGLHPHASRPARRFAAPALIFNLHDQFEQLRADQRYEPLRAKIMERDFALAGSVNPMLARHGQQSGARQYSGRVVNDAWTCPFKGRSTPAPQRKPRTAVVMRHEIAPKTGIAFTLDADQQLTVIDPLGGQVADLLAFNRSDIGEVLSNGRTLDYANKIYLTTGDTLYSNRSRPLLDIFADDVGRHDFLLTPCSRDTFRIIYGDADPHRGCFGNLAEALAPYGVTEDMIPTAFNCFMNVPVNGETGEFKVLPPLSKAGDKVVFKARMDLVIGLTACSALQSNGGSFKPIEYELIGETESRSLTT